MVKIDLGYNYYDTPEGEDCFKKLWYTTKVAGIAGLGISTLDVMLHSHPKGYFPTVARYGYITVPFIGMAAAFTSATCIATTLRQKDDKLNYFIGGCAAGGVFGAWRKNVMAGFLGCVFLGFAAILKKQFIENGWEFFPIDEVILHQRLRQDYTLTKYRPGNWKMSEDD